MPLHCVLTLKDFGDLYYFLVITIKHNPSGLTIGQEGYPRNILAHNHMLSVTSISTTTDASSRHTIHGELFSKPNIYRQVVGSH